MDDRHEYMNEEQEINARIKKSKIMFGVGIGVGLFSFVIMILGVVLQDQGLPWTDPVCVIAALACMLIGLVLLIKAYPGLMVAELDCAKAEYEEKELTQLSALNRSKVEQQLLSCGFTKESGGYFKRKKFSLLRDSIRYYVRIVSGEKLESTVDREEKKFFARVEDEKNACLILFVYPTQFSDAVKENVKSIGTVNIMYEILEPYTICSTLVVAVDAQTDTGYYLDIGKKHRTSLYAHACKMLKKITQTAV